jgi:hypothetical protein
MGAVDLKRAQAAQDQLVHALGERPEVGGVGIARADGVSVRIQTVGRVRKRRIA